MLKYVATHRITDQNYPGKRTNMILRDDDPQNSEKGIRKLEVEFRENHHDAWRLFWSEDWVLTIEGEVKGWISSQKILKTQKIKQNREGEQERKWEASSIGQNWWNIFQTCWQDNFGKRKTGIDFKQRDIKRVSGLQK